MDVYNMETGSVTLQAAIILIPDSCQELDLYLIGFIKGADMPKNNSSDNEQMFRHIRSMAM